MSTMHVFEAAGLGKAPYHYDGCVVTRGSTCQFCSTPIVYQFWLTSSDGKKFYVGSDCIYKSGDAGLRALIEPEVKRRMKEMREEREASLIDQFKKYLVANPGYFSDMKDPHPFSWRARRGDTMGDYKRFLWEHSGRTKRAKFARLALVAAGLIKPTRKPKGAAMGLEGEALSL
jgi:hypothetical protein